MKQFKAWLFVVLVGLSLGGSLAGCIIEDGGGRHWHDGFHEWR